MEIILSAGIAVIVSMICNKILAVHTFNVIDGYVRELVEMTKKSIRDTYFNE